MPVLKDPVGSHYFALEIDGLEIAHFMECSGIKTSQKVFEIEEGGVNGHVHKRPGESTWDNVVLKYATSASSALQAWRERCRAGAHAARSSGAITLYDVDGAPVRRYDLLQIWPVRWTGPSLDASGSALAVEELEIAHEGIAVG